MKDGEIRAVLRRNADRSGRIMCALMDCARVLQTLDEPEAYIVARLLSEGLVAAAKGTDEDLRAFFLNNLVEELEPKEPT